MCVSLENTLFVIQAFSKSIVSPSCLFYFYYHLHLLFGILFSFWLSRLKFFRKNIPLPITLFGSHIFFFFYKTRWKKPSLKMSVRGESKKPMRAEFWWWEMQLKILYKMCGSFIVFICVLRYMRRHQIVAYLRLTVKVGNEVNKDNNVQQQQQKYPITLSSI